MPFSIDFLDDGRVWSGRQPPTAPSRPSAMMTTPRFYVAARDPASDLDLTTLQSVYDQHPDVVATEIVARRPGFRRDEEPVLAVDVAHIDRVTPLARQARQLSDYPVGDLACFNVDFSREFRYCLEAGVDPTPASDLSTPAQRPGDRNEQRRLRGAVRCRRYRHWHVRGALDRRPGALDAQDPDVWSARRARSSRRCTRWRRLPASTTSR